MSLSGDINAVYEDVRNDKTPTNWLSLGYAEEKSDTIQVIGSGSGGLLEFIETLTDDKPVWGYLRITVGNDELSQRSKFILVSWCGETVKVMRKAKLSVHISTVKSVLKSFSVEISASTKKELNEKDITLLLKKAMGANYDRQSSNY